LGQSILAMRGSLTVFPYRGLPPHQFTPMSGAHHAAAGNGAITLVLYFVRLRRAVPEQIR
jgi:hypothetical protein